MDAVAKSTQREDEADHGYQQGDHHLTSSTSTTIASCGWAATGFLIIRVPFSGATGGWGWSRKESSAALNETSMDGERPATPKDDGPILLLRSGHAAVLSILLTCCPRGLLDIRMLVVGCPVGDHRAAMACMCCESPWR